MTSPTDGRSSLYHVVMVAFAGVDTAARVLDRLKVDCAFDDCEIEGAALISRDPDGRIHYHEKGSAGIGAAFGTAAAGLVGLITGPILLPVLLATGAVAGGVAGHFAGQVLPADDLRKVAESLTPGSSAYIAIVDSAHAPAFVAAFGEEGEVVVDAPVETEISSAVREAVLHEVRRG
jgi:uncharacterized membrane protein